MRVLAIEDDRRISSVIKKGLTEDRFAIDTAFDGDEGQYLAESESYDLIILDIMLPKVDGLTICKELRAKNIKTPILMLTAKTSLEDRVTGLDSGADDYLAKPFAYIELRSRAHALIRRNKQNPLPVLKIADMEIDSLKHKATRAGKPIALTPKEFAILELLLRHKDEVVTRTMVTEHVWDYNFDSMSNIIDVFVAALRRKVDKGAKIPLIHTVHGVGYKISDVP